MKLTEVYYYGMHIPTSFSPSEIEKKVSCRIYSYHLFTEWQSTFHWMTINILSLEQWRVPMRGRIIYLFQNLPHLEQSRSQILLLKLSIFLFSSMQDSCDSLLLSTSSLFYNCTRSFFKLHTSRLRQTYCINMVSVTSNSNNLANLTKHIFWSQNDNLLNILSFLGEIVVKNG